MNVTQRNNMLIKGDIIENTKENIKKIFKETKENIKNEFIMGLEKYFKKNKVLSDKQFDCLMNWHQEKQNKDEKE